MSETASAQEKPDLAAVPSADELRVELQGSCAVISLNRPRALNALSLNMRTKLAEAFPKFARDPQVYCCIIQSASDRAFSAGGDVREIVAMARQDLPAARQAFREEYSLNWLHECFSKPTVSLIDGAVMGSGVGISLFGTHRVAGERYRFAMPETAIGLFPDVGVSWALARMPNSIGMYLGLTGRTIGAADAYALGLLTHCIPAARFDEIRQALADTWPVDTVLDDRHVDPGPGELAPLETTIAHCFSAPTVEEIIARLQVVGGDHRAWAGEVADELATRSPLSLKITHRHIRDAAALDLRQTLAIDYRLACRFLEGADFYEGVRAVLIDKDGRARWNPHRLEDVSDVMVDDYFASLGESELILLTRQQMQAARV
ncbi:enoyl-CoA hydratase/isomerase family protein [Hyphomicrobium sulfonivorans]|nr:enoyl-CoA hydratase/isomerase family protein [Hyphomicrobium sulfonivorans]